MVVIKATSDFTSCSWRPSSFGRQRIPFCSLMTVIALTTCLQFTKGNPPNIDYSHNMRVLKLPRDTKIGTLIYRLKGSDPEPQVLTFGVRGSTGKSLLDVRPAGFAEADVYLKGELKESEYKVIIFVTDGKETTEVESTILVTNGTSESVPFFAFEYLLVVPEDTPTNETVGTIQAKERVTSSLPVTFELKGSDKFTIRYVFGPRGISKAVIILLQSVDYEKQNLFKLTVLAMNAWTNESVDTRNVATAELVVVITDAQDTPPIFVDLPSVVVLPDTLRSGDEVVVVKAEDGDYGIPRPVTYSISFPDGESFFSVNSSTGQMRLARSIDSIRDTIGSSSPILVQVTATEVADPSDPVPPMDTSAMMVFVIVSTQNHAPKFLTERLVGSVEENSPVLTAVQWKPPSVPRVTDEDQGPNGTMDLYLDGGEAADIFDIMPSKGFRDIEFSVVVKTPAKLDYEKLEQKYFDFRIVARDNGVRRSLTSKTDARIYVEDTNDHVPKFSKSVYEISIPENSPAGTTLVQVLATDEDSGNYGKIRYTSLNGPIANELSLNEETGEIVLLSNSTLDREKVPEYTLTIEARDEDGKGNRNIAQIVIQVEDVNDNSPRFVQPRYDAVLKRDKSGFLQPLFVKATDADAPGPNSDIIYEIVSGNYQDKYAIDAQTGQLSLKEPLEDDRGSVSEGIYTLGIRAYDQGFPHRSAMAYVYIHSQDYLNRTVTFSIPVPATDARNRKEEIERGLSSFTGGNVNLLSIKPHNASGKASVIRAWVTYPLVSSVDYRALKYMIRDIYGGDYEKESEKISKAELVDRYDYDVVFWLLIVLVILVILALLVFCCCWICCRSKERQSFAELKKKLIKDKNTTPLRLEREIHDSDRSRFQMKEAWSDTAPKKLLRRSVRPSSEPIDIGSSDRREGTEEPHLSSLRRTRRLYSPPNRRQARGEYRETTDDQLKRFLFQQSTRDGDTGDDDQQIGRYFVVRKDMRRSRHQGLVGEAVEDLDDMNANRRQTEILYIRSPPDDGTARGMTGISIPRSISQLALDGSNETQGTEHRDYGSHQLPEQYQSHIPRGNVLEDSYISSRRSYPAPYHQTSGIGHPRQQWRDESHVPDGYDSHLQQDYHTRRTMVPPSYPMDPENFALSNQQSVRFIQDGDRHSIVDPVRQQIQRSEQFRNSVSNRRTSPPRLDESQTGQAHSDGEEYSKTDIRQHATRVLKTSLEQTTEKRVPPDSQSAILPSTTPLVRPRSQHAGVQLTDVDDSFPSHEQLLSRPPQRTPQVSDLPRDPIIQANATSLNNSLRNTTTIQAEHSLHHTSDTVKSSNQLDSTITTVSPRTLPTQNTQLAAGGHATNIETRPNNQILQSDNSTALNVNISSGIDCAHSSQIRDSAELDHSLTLDILENEIKESLGANGRQDDDTDSGIGQGSLQLKKGSMLEKKSLFTIAYNGIQTRQLKSREGEITSP